MSDNSDASERRNELAEPFFYEALLEQVRRRKQGGIRIHGGRGFGRSRFLQELERRGMPVSGQTELIRGRWSDAQVRMRRLAEGLRSAPAALLIDDLDVLLMKGGERIDQPAARVIEYYGTSGRVLVLTTAHLSNAALSQSEAWSHWVMQLETWPLAPWELEWRGLLRNAVQTHWKQQCGRWTVELGGRRLRLDNQFLTTWIGAVVELTGGHPSLVGPAVGALWCAPSGNGDADCAATDEFLKLHVTSILSTSGLPALRNRVMALRNSENPVERGAFEVLVQSVAGTPAKRNDPFFAKILEVVLREGLAYLKGDRLEVIGSLIGAELVTIASFPPVPSPPAPQPAPAPASPALELLPDEFRPEERGTVVFQRESGTATLVLTGILWKIFSQLYQAGGEPVSVRALEATLERNQPAVRSAIQRLKKALHGARLDSLMLNTEGGYALRFPRSSG